MPKRKNPSHYNRQTSQYRKNLYRGELNRKGIKPPKFRNNALFKKVVFLLGIIWVVTAMTTIFINRHLALLVLLIGVLGVAGVVFYINREDKRFIKAYMEIGVEKTDFIDAMKKRGTNQEQIVRVSKLWDKVEKKEHLNL